ncbi:DUF5412 domain-containing protein [Brevibacillus sp. SAFN-007a]|uniref:DUF5412 domain-containing protein n=1 Tax=Brevibacillus sp. SAFN-007a TaxID=3436862 RepID=UPI003F7FBC9D
MKKTLMRSIVVIVSILACIVGYLIYPFFYSMSHLPQGTLIEQSISPSGEFTVNAYLVNGGATTALCVRGELQNNKTGKRKNMYWDYRIDKAEIVWINNETVSINGHVLSIKNDTFDWRRE